MPAVSKRQWEKMYALCERGQITKAQLNRFVKGVRYASLPERAKKKRRRK